MQQAWEGGGEVSYQWQPIETAPTDGEQDIFIAKIVDGEVKAVDFYAFQEWEQESWEIPKPYLVWVSAFGSIEEPTHWAPMPEMPEMPGKEVAK